MRVVYEWTQSEWDEAVRLAAAKKRRRGSVSSITIGVILVPLIGGAITGLINLRQHHMVIVGATILPLLLGLLALCVVLWVVGMKLRMRRLRAAEPMPAGECEIVLQEGGWRFCALSGNTVEPTPEATAVVPTEEVVIEAVEASDAPLLASEPVVVSPTASLMPWSSMTGMRDGRHVVVFLHEGGFAGVPMRCLSEDQVGHVQRMMARKLRPAPTRR